MESLGWIWGGVMTLLGLAAGGGCWWLHRTRTLLPTSHDTLDTLPDPVIEVDDAGRIVCMNAAALRLFDLPDPAPVGTPLLRLLHPQDRDRAEEHLGRVLHNETAPPGEYRALRNGAAFPMRLHARRSVTAEGTSVLRATLRDLTDLYLLEEQLYDSEARYHALADHSDELIFTIDLAGHLTSVNEAMVNLLGYERDALIDRDALELVAPEAQALAQRMREMRFRGTVEGTRYELVLLGRDGTRHYIEVGWQSRRQAGRLIGFQGIARNIAERKQAQHHLSLLRQTLDRAPSAILWLDEEARVMYANDAACRWLGYNHAELLTKRAMDFDPLLSYVKWRTHVTALHRAGEITLTTRHRDAAGREHPVLITATHMACEGRWYHVAYVQPLAQPHRSGLPAEPASRG